MDNQENNQSDLQELQPGDDLSVDFDDLNVELSDPDPGAAGLEEVSDLSVPEPLPGDMGSGLDEDPEELEPVALSEEELENILGDSDVQDVLAAPIEEEDPGEADSEPAAVFEEETAPPILEEEAPGDVPVDDDIFLNDGDLELDDADLQLDEPDTDLPELGADDLLDDVSATGANPDEIDTSDELDLQDIDELEMPDELMDTGDDAGDAETLPPLSLDDDDDEPVTLSEDELGNILDDVEPTDEIQEGDSGPSDIAAEPAATADEEEDILSLTDDEPLGDMSDDLETVADADMPSALAGDDDEDESITLSDEELSRVLLDTDELDGDAAAEPEMAEALGPGPGADESSFEVDMTADDPGMPADDEPVAPSLTSLDMDDDDEPITLTAEELGNIVSDTEEEAVDAPAMTPPDDELDLAPDMTDASDELEPAAVSILDGDDDDEPVALSENELANILEDVDDAEPIEAAGMEPVDELGEVAPPAADGDSPVIVLDEYDDSPKDDDSGVAAGVAAAGAAAAGVAAVAAADDRADSPVVAETAAEQGVDLQEMKKMISYLDGLFDKLPDDTVREFSRSEYFDLYKKIMGELGL